MKLNEAFRALDALNEDTFSISDDGINKLSEFEQNDDLTDEISVIDIEAETEDDLQDSYIGKVILDCSVCHSKLYKDKEEVELDEEGLMANVGEECPYCYTSDGFKVIGEVAAFGEVEEETEEVSETENTKDMKKVTEAKSIKEAAFSGGVASNGSVDRYARPGGNTSKATFDKLDNKKTKTVKAKDLKPGMVTDTGKITQVKDVGWRNGKPSVEVSYGGVGNGGSYAADVVAADRDYQVMDESKSIKEDISKTSFTELKDTVEELSELTGLTIYVSEPDEEDDSVELFCDEVFDIEGTGLIDVIEHSEYGYELDTETVLDYLTNIGLYEPDEELDESKNIKESFKIVDRKTGFTIDNGFTTERDAINEIKDKYQSEIGRYKVVKESLEESVNNVNVETDDSIVNVSTDDNGKVTVTTEPNAAPAESGDEIIAPVSPETEAEIKNNTTEETPNEDEFVDMEVDEFDEQSFDELGESYLKETYDNIDSYKTTTVSSLGNKIFIEGVIRFNSGNEKPTKFIFEAKDLTKYGRARFIGENVNITRGKKAFKIKGQLEKGKFITESFNYNYKTTDNEGKSTRVYGTINKRG